MKYSPDNYRQTAQLIDTSRGVVIESDAPVDDEDSIGKYEGGAWVQCWIWVDDNDVETQLN